LAGDLVEQYEHGRSRIWLWRQVLSAIIVCAFHEMHMHKWLALRAIVVGYACCEAFMYGIGALAVYLVGSDVVRVALLPFLGCCAWAAGWIVSRTHPRSTVIICVSFCWALSVAVFAAYFTLPLIDRQPLSVLAFFAALDFVVMPLGFLIGGVQRPIFDSPGME
jgi:hypothetical protein